jgi:hypothetical protein
MDANFYEQSPCLGCFVHTVLNKRRLVDPRASTTDRWGLRKLQSPGYLLYRDLVDPRAPVTL